MENIKPVYRLYNGTWRNERQAEVPLVLDALAGQRTDMVLEIGNVLSHYFKTSHRIIDKTEGPERVDIHSGVSGKYSLIISISTMEHVGYDEYLGPYEKVIKQAFKNVINALLPGGEFIFTVPCGYNRVLENMLVAGEIKTDKLVLYKKQGLGWIEGNKGEFYGYGYKRANAFYLGTIKKA